MPKAALFLRIFAVAITVVYPIVVYFGLQRFDARYLVLLLVVVAGARLLMQGRGSTLNRWFWLPMLGLLIGWTWVSGSSLGLKLYPVLMSASLFIVFCWSLRYPPTAIERLARLQEPDLPDSGVRYTRNVTKVWCVFFVVNGGIALWTVMFGTDQQWALYNGIISYLLMGLLFAVEWLVRQGVKHREST